MKTIKITRAALLLAPIIPAAMLATGCKVKTGMTKTTAGGKPFEIVAAVSDEVWSTPVADTLKAVFSTPVEMLNQPEPQFDLARVRPQDIKNLLLRHRNLLIIQVDPKAGEPSNSAVFDRYASPQVMLTITAPDPASLAQYLSDNRNELLTVFNNEERKRNVSYFEDYGNRTLEEEAREKFGIDISIPLNYSRRNAKLDDNFMWVGFDEGIVINGIVIYSYPYAGNEDFSAERLLERRGQFMGNINGPRFPEVHSYMITSPYVEPDVRYLRIDGRLWTQIRGWWEMENDFMGGPFVSYSTLDTNTNRVITIEGFLYSPKKDKRNALRALEHIVYTVSFPDPEEL